MKTDKYIPSDRLENMVKVLYEHGSFTVTEAIAAFAVVVAIANDRAIDGTAWIEECRSLCVER